MELIEYVRNNGRYYYRSVFLVSEPDSVESTTARKTVQKCTEKSNKIKFNFKSLHPENPLQEGNDDET